MMKNKLKVVIDTNVVLSALRSLNGASNKLMTLLGTDKFIPCISIGLILEYEDVLSRKLHNLNKIQVKQFLDYICLVSEQTKVHFLWRPTLKDPRDHMLLELAVAARASYIITYNIVDFKEANKFNIEIIRPRDFLDLIGEPS
jgi:putative PIN family toxin of toxin-antitoxin system